MKQQRLTKYRKMTKALFVCVNFSEYRVSANMNNWAQMLLYFIRILNKLLLQAFFFFLRKYFLAYFIFSF